MVFTAYIVECVRTPGGKNRSMLSKKHPADLGGLVIDECIRRANLPGKAVDDVIFGCVSQIGAQAANIGRGVVLSSSLPESVPGVTVDRQCGSSLQAIHFAAQAVMSGTQDIVIAGGVEVMSLIPIGSNVMDGLANNRGMPSGERIQERYPGVMFSQFEGAELLAEKWNVTRDEMEDLAIASHRKAFEATKNGYFKREIIPVKGTYDRKTKQESPENVMTADEGIRWPTTKEKLQKLPLLKGEGGRITAATASQISDGAACVLIVNEKALEKYPHLKPRAKIVSLGLAGTDPVVMLGGPIDGTYNALEKAGLKITDIDLYEVNEAFASVPLAWFKAFEKEGATLDRLNVNGGAMALGHPLGCTGAKLTTTLVHELERRNKRYGLLAICEGGGTSNCTIIERVDCSNNNNNNNNNNIRSRL
eukprot:TRINITY_DN525_c7_g1_i1.p1 TRINITY_DN525_c7_g1~~TRINITY_DN525_c7_g1_i1.p1  ORF type:complete len:420 (+),score=212.07 TRINITY_DN525_c7_g1_i1:137-1396(+)